MLCLAMVTLGVEVGWRPLPDGGFEYIIQIEPQMLGLLARGEEIFSDIPPTVRDVRSYRITVGTGQVLREGRMEPEPADRSLPGQPGDGDPVASPLSTPPLEEPSVAPAFPGLRYTHPAPTPPPEKAADDPPGPSEASVSPAPLWEPPLTLPPSADTQPLSESAEKPAYFVDQEKEEGAPSAPEPGNQGEPAAAAPESDKPSPPFTLALAGFLGAFGGMLYTGWLAWDYRRRYRALLERMIGAGPRPEDLTAQVGHLPGLAPEEEQGPSES
jgi:hypothetical protein